MFSDGKVTDVAMSVSSNTTDTWPAENDSSWTAVVPRSPVGAGYNSGGGYKSCPSVYDFGARSGRYIRLDFWNAGQFGSPNWIETAGAKLFFENTLVSSESSCPPEPPTNASASAGNATATVYWTAPTGSITSYSLQYSSNNGSSWSTATTVPASVPGTATSAQVTGLTNGTAYVFRVRASNVVGISPYSTQTAPVTPTGAALNPPTNVSATGGNASATVFWTASIGATSYQVTGSPSGSCTATAPNVSCLVTGLTNGLTYTFTVAATNGIVTSPVSAQSNPVTPMAPPSYAITETANPMTGGTVSCTPNPVDFGGTSTCNATVNAGYTFTDWSGACTGTGACTLTNVTSAQSVTANFTVAANQTFTGPTATETGGATATVSGGGATCGFTNAQFVVVSVVPAAPPAGYSFPHGLFDFTLANCAPGGTATLTLTYPSALPAGTVYWKYGPTPSNASPTWYRMPATITGNTATFTITDGGLGDDDLAANGAIVDQGGPGVPGVPGGAGATAIPTLSEWAMLALMGLLLGYGGWRLRRRESF